MSVRARDQLAGAILFVIALAWIVVAYWAIPGSADAARLGARAFPVGMGIALASLSLLLIGGTLLGATQLGARHAVGIAAETVEPDGETRVEYWALLATFGFLLGHLLLLTWFGFVVGTVLATAAFLWFVLKQRSPMLLVGLPLGLSFGIWFVLGKLMGVYLPRGSIVDLF